MKGLQMKAGLHAIKSHTLNKPLSSPRRLMGFREWCEKVWEPSKRMREERWFPWGETFGQPHKR
jgi:hypothetical protein